MIHENSQDFGKGFTNFHEGFVKDLHDFGKGFVRIHKGFGKGFVRIHKTLGGFMKLWERIIIANPL